MSRWRCFVSFSLNHYHRGIFKSGVLCISCKYFINKIHKNICLNLKLFFTAIKLSWFVLYSFISYKTISLFIFQRSFFLSFTLHKLVFVFRVINFASYKFYKNNFFNKAYHIYPSILNIAIENHCQISTLKWTAELTFCDEVYCSFGANPWSTWW